jgi:hypothetical protein
MIRRCTAAARARERVSPSVPASRRSAAESPAGLGFIIRWDQRAEGGARMLSTIILNWNRVELLRQCIDSYFATVGADYELMIATRLSRLTSPTAAADTAVALTPKRLGAAAKGTSSKELETCQWRISKIGYWPLCPKMNWSRWIISVSRHPH